MNDKPTTTNKITTPLLLGIKTAAFVSAAVVLLGVLYSYSNSQPEVSQNSLPHDSESPTAPAGKYTYQVGKPGPGVQAPPFELTSTTGAKFNLAARRGKTVLLFFQEGLMCPACWDQIRDIEKDFEKFQALGIDEMVSISTDSIEVLKQKQALEKYKTPLLSDPSLEVSKTYTTNLYGMMGNSMNGHSFILVGPDGKILWRADYGSAPNYTMYVPTANLIADLRQSLQ